MGGKAVTSENLREVVEQALETEDMIPLVGELQTQGGSAGLPATAAAAARDAAAAAPPQVRLVFDAHPSEPGALPLPAPLDSESGTTTLDEAGALLRDNPLETVRGPASALHPAPQ